MSEAPGRPERELALALVTALPRSAGGWLELDGIDLRPAAEHLLYTALRQPAVPRAPSAAGALLRGALRPLLGARSTRRRPRVAPGAVVALITSPVHATLFAPVAETLTARGAPPPFLVAARTSDAGHADLASVTDVDLPAWLPAGRLRSLSTHAARTAIGLRQVPAEWAELAGGRAEALSAVLRASLPRAALDVARLDGLLSAARPAVVACFSESGLLARLAPAAARRHDVPVVDLPHAEAADPWGTAGSGYDAVAVTGPRAADAMRLAGYGDDAIVEIGPLRYDALIRAAAEQAPDDEPRVVFASQPVDAARPHLAEPVKRHALAAAGALAAASGAELVVVPHPTEDPAALAGLVTGVAGGRARVGPPGSLHAQLIGARALITSSSQSVFDAVVAGVPAVTVRPPGMAPPVAFAAEGIATELAGPEGAAALASMLAGSAERARMVAAARAALGDRIGPLDGRAAERAAEWLLAVARGASVPASTIGPR